ncbi:hypothetical protein FQN54_005798 [Arachnomyces sp. PD_36]|nr:hypothetical protein FQN54_005798 [Arachnomyces sp. PD_36]
MLKFVALPAPLAVDEARSVTRIVDEESSAPCRRCLQDGKVGEEMVLTPYDPFLDTSPYSGLGPIFVHRKACERYECDGSVPDQQRRRLLSVRAFDEKHMLVGFAVTEGKDLAEKAEGLFKDLGAEYLHAHYAGPGCFAVRVDKVK